MRILLIEDERKLAGVIKKGLTEQGFTVDMAHDGEEGFFMVENYPADVIILDIMLPQRGGLSLLSALRQKGIQTPVLLLTAMDSVGDKIKGLDKGADDYLTKPFDFGELLARIRVLLRRKYEKKEPTITIGDLKINTSCHEVVRNGESILLTAKEYVILEYMAFRKGEVITRTELTEHIYDENFDKDSNIVDVYINHLRKKLHKGSSMPLIHTIRGAGYILKVKEL